MGKVGGQDKRFPDGCNRRIGLSGDKTQDKKGRNKKGFLRSKSLTVTGNPKSFTLFGKVFLIDSLSREVWVSQTYGIALDGETGLLDANRPYR